MSPLQDLAPQPLWSCFDAIRRIPRPSKNEERIAAHVRAWADVHDFTVRSDAAGNLVVAVPATPGREDAPLVVLQSHLDMVCEKNADVVHDFSRDPIPVTVDGDWVRAEGTTLGADNGVGVAAAMAVAIDPEATHGPLELLFTLDEETGLNGAAALDPGLVTGRILINLDTEEDDAVYIGCAGAAGVAATLALARTPDGSGERWRLAVAGLRGGHSGVDIHLNRANAVKVAARVLIAAAGHGIPFGVVAWHGGAKANAIPRESFVELTLERPARERLTELIAELSRELREEYGTVDPELRITLERSTGEARAPLVPADRDRLLRLVDAAPHGVFAMSREVPELVETSNNVAVVTTGDGFARLDLSLRSSVNPALTGAVQSLESLCRLAGAETRGFRGYPGWRPDPDSPLVKRTAAAYARLFGEPPAVKAVHAGLECGILAEKLGGLAAVSIGPEIRDPHSPSERVRISSVGKFYRLLKELLADLSSGG